MFQVRFHSVPPNWFVVFHITHSATSPTPAYLLISKDACDIEAAIGADNFDNAKRLYQGTHVPEKVLQNLAYRVSSSDEEALNEEFYSAGVAFFDDTNWMDTYISDALGDTGIWAGRPEARKQAIKKGTVGMIPVAYMIHELEEALGDVEAGNTDDDEGAPHKVDEAFGLYAGNACSGGSPFINAEKRRASFGTTTVREDGTCLATINEDMITKFNSLLAAARNGDLDTATSEVKAIKNLILASYAQPTLLYAKELSDMAANGDAIEYEDAEGLTFFYTIAPLLSADNAKIIEAEFLNSTEGTYGTVKSALDSAFADAGIDAADVGEPLDEPEAVECTSVTEATTAAVEGVVAEVTDASSNVPASVSVVGAAVLALLL